MGGHALKPRTHMGLLAAQPGAFDLFWLPLAAAAIGTMILTTRNPRQAKLTGGAIALIGLCFIALSPLTLPNSPSSAFGQLLLLLVGPSLLVLLALWLKLEDREDVFGKRFITAMQVMGVPIDSFGTGSMQTSKTVSEIVV